MPLTKPDAERHLARACSNFQFYEKLKSEQANLDWAVTVLFYSALHLVQAHFVEVANTGFDIPRDHPERDNLVARLIPAIYSHYRFLGSRSQWSRYHVDKPPTTPSLIQSYEENHFRPIVSTMEALGVQLILPNQSGS
jgi:hypothetical protein